MRLFCLIIMKGMKAFVLVIGTCELNDKTKLRRYFSLSHYEIRYFELRSYVPIFIALLVLSEN